MKINKPKFWLDTNFISLLLIPITFLYIFLVYLKNIFTKTHAFPIKVICLGNIYLGGTGKTPLAIYLAKTLTKMSNKTVIIKKYYPGHIDEIQLLKNNYKKIITNKSRYKAIKIASQKNMDVAVLDDGFQDNSIYKNLNILCFNSNQLIGNGMPFPSGPLRELFGSIKKSQIIIINGKKNINFEKKIKKISKKIKIFYSSYIPLKIAKYKNKKVLAFAGIGNSNNFFNLLVQNNIDVKKKLSFPDHYKYNRLDIKNITNLAKREKLNIVTTEKDFFRLKNIGYNNFQYIKVKLKIFNEKKFKLEVNKYLR